MSRKGGGPILDELNQQLLFDGVTYLLPTSHLEMVGHVPESAPEVVFRAAAQSGLIFEWLGRRYALTNHRDFSDHEQRMVRSIGRFLSTRYALLFDGETTTGNMPIFGGLAEDRYVSAFLDGRVFGDIRSATTLPDRISEAIEVLRISALSSSRTNEYRPAPCYLGRCRMPVTSSRGGLRTHCSIQAS